MVFIKDQISNNSFFLGYFIKRIFENPIMEILSRACAPTWAGGEFEYLNLYGGGSNITHLIKSSFDNMLNN